MGKVKDIQIIAMHTDGREPDMWQLYIRFYGTKKESELLMQRIKDLVPNATR